jgi:hypothetical protein
MNKVAEHFRKQRDEGLIELSQMYSSVDMQEFAERCSVNTYFYDWISRSWKWITEELKPKTTSQLLEEFKVWKEEQK